MVVNGIHFIKFAILIYSMVTMLYMTVLVCMYLYWTQIQQNIIGRQGSSGETECVCNLM